MSVEKNETKNAFQCDLNGKLALITGAASGIGLGIAELLARAGAETIIVDLNLEDAKKGTEKLVSSGYKAHYRIFDLSNIRSIALFYEKDILPLGSPDILINNAGINIRGPVEEISIDSWQKVIDINLTAVFALTQVWSKDRIKRKLGGKIINIASLMSVAARPTCAPYTASKGAIGLLTKALAVDLAKYGITVNAIGPGYINTEMNKTLYAQKELNDWIMSRTPMKRLGKVEDIAKIALFLSSELSDFVTGQIIFADGGWLASL